MSLKLTQVWTDECLKHPETGMGSQIVTLILKDGRRLESCMVQNAEWVDLPVGVTCTVEDIQAIEF